MKSAEMLHRNGSKGSVVIEVGADGIRSVTIDATCERGEQEAKDLYGKIRPLLDQIDKELRGSYGPQG